MFGTVIQNGNKIGAILWKCDLPTQAGPPVIADVEGQGTASILLVGEDG